MTIAEIIATEIMEDVMTEVHQDKTGIHNVLVDGETDVIIEDHLWVVDQGIGETEEVFKDNRI